MSIKLNNFVNINIEYENTSSYSSTRDTAVLILFGANTYINENFDLVFSSKEDIKNEYEKEDSKTTSQFYSQYQTYFDSFFDNTGRYLRIIGVQKNELATVDELKSIINGLEDRFVVIASNSSFTVMKEIAGFYKKITGTSQKLILGYCPNKSYLLKENQWKSIGIDKFIIKYGNENYKELIPAKAITATSTAIPCVASEEVTEDTEINPEKVYATRTTSSAGAGKLNDGTYAYTLVTEGNPHDLGAYEITTIGANANTAREGIDYYTREESSEGAGYLNDGTYGYTIVSDITENETDISSYFILTTIGQNYNEEDNYKGIEMSIAGYLTNIDINRYDSVQDYAFTQEDFNEKTILPYITVNDNELAKSLLSVNVNFIGELINKSRNLGGNDSNGNSVINMFMLICLHQTLAEKLTSLLITKIKYNQTGLSQISAVLNKELQKYVDNGYLTTNKTWVNDDLYYKGTLVIKKNTPLSLGYRYVILPFSSLDPEEVKNKELPDIYILIADSYGIRKIDVFGRTY